PSARGELEITDLNNLYLQDGSLTMQLLSRGYAWLDAGTAASLNEASNFICAVETQQNILISALEEIAYLHGWITTEQLADAAERYGKSPYGEYLKRVLNKEFVL
ncbi:MAG: glucose-1-phosphate thymidylyltransferase, partial [Clostridia bacterium]|nr:glucose-1-phosphate thymidylyltransferase [Clostridia bacterium]